ncbi:MAG: hypothetical protein WC661_02185 [Opitutaceae bacterium]|jgi:hypothetical protein
MPASPTTRKETPFANSRYIWAEGLAPNRNQFVSFEHGLAISAPPSGPVLIHLFADTRYRLWVNERFIAYGPARFVTAHPEYDTYDLAPHLRSGTNLVRVEVNYYGSASYQSMPDGLPGFIAAGGLPGNDFATPGSWRARHHKAWDAEAPHFSFAQNPAEICDTRVLAAELASVAPLAVRILPAESAPWPIPSPRSAPYPDYVPVRPARVSVAGPVERMLRWGLRLRNPDHRAANRQNHAKHARFTTWIHSPRQQSIPLDCFWSELALNGKTLQLSYSGRYGNHGETTLNLSEGWNFLSCQCEVVLEYWTYILGFHPASGVTLHARPDRACNDAFAVSPLVGPGLFPFPTSPDHHRIPDGWHLDSGALERLTPSRLVAWDRPDETAAVRDLPCAHLSEADAFVASDAIWCFDFGDEYYGQPVITVEAPPGSVLDVAYDDWRRHDGCVNLYGSNPFTDAADRFILRGGRQTIAVANPRGGIFLQVTLRVRAGSKAAPLRVHDVHVLRRTTLNERAGRFACGDPLMDWAWSVSVHTLQASTDESYADCPWRERGSYIGDGLVNLHLHRLVTADLSVARRTFAIFGQAQLPDGQLQCCAPSWLAKPHQDFTLIWVQAVRDFWALTGDAAFAAAQLPVIRRIFAAPSWASDADGLWDATGMRVFIDWGVLVSEREGPANAAINILRIAALRAAADLADALDHASEAAGYRTEATRVTDALVARVWNKTQGRFDASAGADTPALHANILAFRYGVGPADRILAYLQPLLRDNFRRGVENGQSGGFAELYFFYYLIPALVVHDRVALAESMIAETYGFIKSLGYPTLTECFHRANEGRGSCCHSWSGAPAIYATDYVLGLRMASPGRPDSYLLDPVDSGRQQVSGSIPHARGLITASWKRQPGGRISARVTAPAGVIVTPAAHVDILPAQAARAICPAVNTR